MFVVARTGEQTKDHLPGPHPFGILLREMPHLAGHTRAIPLQRDRPLPVRAFGPPLVIPLNNLVAVVGVLAHQQPARLRRVRDQPLVTEHGFGPVQRGL